MNKTRPFMRPGDGLSPIISPGLSSGISPGISPGISTIVSTFVAISVACIVLLSGSASRAEVAGHPAVCDAARDRSGTPTPTLDQIRHTIKDLLFVRMGPQLIKLEQVQACGALPALSAYIDERLWDHRALRTAVLMVQTLQNGPVDMEDTSTSSAIKLLSFQIQKLYPWEQEALLEYAARKLGNHEHTEALLAFVRGHIPDHIEHGIAAVTEPVPRGAWDPPGKQAIPFYIGNRVHEQIALYYTVAHKTETVRANTVSISSILHQLVRSGVGPAANAKAQAIGNLALRPDIVNLSTREIYEIKPAGAEAAAQALVALHIATFAKAGVAMAPGRTSAPGVHGVVPAPAGHAIFYSPEPGVIVYRYQRGDFVPSTVPEPERQNQPGESPVPVATEQRSPAHALTSAPRSEAADTGIWATMERATGLTGAALGLYLVVSEGSRVLFPPRNLLPVP